jgi:ADP-ribose pyrophosphatase YjhB (NUDIX family)
VVNGVQRALIRVWRHVPRRIRRWIVRVAAPSFTVGAACVVERGDGRILLVRLAYRDGWGLPGGLIKRREDVAACARREVGEEIGLDVELLGAPAVVVDARPQRIDVVFRARVAAGSDPDAAAPRSPEIREVRWFAAGELPALQHEAVSALMALASSALREEPSVLGSEGSGPVGSSADDDGAALRLAAARAADQDDSLAS